MKKVVVTGAGGFVGRHVTQELLEQGCTVYAVYHHPGLPLKAQETSRHFHPIFCDLLADTKPLERLKTESIDTWYHFAWKGSYGEERNNFLVQNSNVILGWNCLHTAYTIGCKKWIGIGTVSEFLLTDNHCSRKEWIPHLQYIIAKDYLNRSSYTSISGKSMEYVWCRLSNIYGPDLSINNILSYSMKTLLQERMPLFSDAVQPYNFIHIKDCVKALYLIGERKPAQTVYFIGGKEVFPLKEFLVKTRDAIDPSLPLGIGHRPSDGLCYQEDWFDISPLEHDFGFSPSFSFQKGIQQTVDILKQNRKEENQCVGYPL